ncbi:CsgG/HfaB family protein [Brevundimonas sp.]|uniref:CsgG/HfaB family protein n=1 Tax=Brevundimonas sp. TaxID=1871086 RepID=UPI001DBD4107|nr:CsgG/HfaB family protein [Brevundimonas sp.]MBA4001691.1 curli production assembly/transport component csgg [Brevundimonas sp.]
MARFKLILCAAVASATALAGALPAEAQNRRSGAQRTQDDMMAQIPRCARNLGTVAIADGQADVFRELQLSPPQSLLRAVIQRSGCFTLLDRGAGMSVAQRERDLAAGGDLQRGSNVGGGQIRAADYVLVGEVASQNSNSGGNALAGIAGGLLGRRNSTLGAVVGGISTRRSEANTVLSLTDVRTSETVMVTEGYASRNDISWGAGGAAAGSSGFGGAVGGGYENTEIGRMVAQAFIQAYADMVTQMGGMNPDAGEAAPVQTFVVQQATTMRSAPETGSVVRALPEGLRVYPTGNRDGMWWEIMDDNDNIGWVQNDRLAPGT